MKNLFLTVAAFCAVTSALAGPGMWVPLFIEDNIADIRAAGGLLTAEQIYSANSSSLKDAIMIFGGGCTGEMVSESGLILTNYHCGEGVVGSLSSTAADYMAHGFTARDLSDELPCPGLEVRKLAFMRDVSDKLTTLSDTATANALRRETSDGGRLEVDIEELFCGNQHILLAYEVFKDVRLVVAPPQQLGRFGGETDNWVWPRHTADFTLFRVYADQENKPATYSASNRPYRPSHVLPVNIGGVKEGDFAMVMGYPGSTDLYLSATAIEAMRQKIWPQVVTLRMAETDALDKLMNSDRKAAIDYAAHYSGIANGRKRTAGEIDCTDKSRMVETMRSQQAALRQDPRMDSILASMDSIFSPAYLANELTRRLTRDVWLGSRTLILAGRIATALAESKLDTAATISQLNDFLSRSDATAERKTLEAGLRALQKSGAKGLPSLITSANPRKLAKAATSGIFGHNCNPNATFHSADLRQTVDGHMATRLAMALMQTWREKAKANSAANKKLHDVKAAYARRLAELRPDSLLTPDANFTMRVAYGHVEAPRTGRKDIDIYFTTARGILKKNATGNHDFALADSLKTALSGNYGPYADADGQLHTCFTGSIHTTGGNSGSPTLNARGELIGLNFDRIWNGIASDYRFDTERSRNISVDIRYVLFVIDKVCHGGHIVGQMNIVGRDGKQL